MQTENGSTEFPRENAGSSLKPWQTPEIEVLIVDQTEADGVHTFSDRIPLGFS